MNLEGRTAIVTGGGSGIGRAIALAYAREGARVVVSDIAGDAGEETVEMIRQATAGAEAVFVRADSARPEDHEALIEAAVERYGRVAERRRSELRNRIVHPVDGGYLAR